MKTVKTNTSLDKKVKARNDKFKKLSKPQQRVAIARDVLAQLKLNKLSPQTGDYFSVESNNSSKLLTDTHDSLQKLLLDTKIKPGCTGCVLGGMFMCSVRNSNTVSVEDRNSRTDHHIIFDKRVINTQLNKHFSSLQLALIESAYEGDDFYPDDPNNIRCTRRLSKSVRDQVERATGYIYNGQYSDYERMSVIMQNIIVNGGTFKLSTKPVFKNGNPRILGFKS